MNFILGSIQTEFDNLVQEINDLEFCTISQIDDLKSGFVISQMILRSIRRPDLFTMVQGFTKDKILARWSIAQDFMKIHFHVSLDDYLPEEIQNDQGVLFIVCKFITKVLKDPRKSSISRIWTSLNTSISNVYKTFANGDESLDFIVDLEDLKGVIHHWLQDLKMIPRGIYMHEFLYRVRNGLSLNELLKKLDSGYKRNLNFVAKPGCIADCIKNINFVLRHLRKNTLVHKRFLHASASIYEGNQEIVYGLLADIREFYLQQQGNQVTRRPPSPKRSQKSYAETPKVKKVKKEIPSSVKNSIIDWITSVRLLHKVVFTEDFKKSSLENGTLLCELIQKLFSCELGFIPKPKTLEECQKNLTLALKFLETKGFNVSSKEIIVSEEFTWSVLYEIMNNYHEKGEPNKMGDFKDLEVKILSWLKQSSFIPFNFSSIFDVIPLIQSGQLLRKLVNQYLAPTEPLKDSPESLALIKDSLKLLKKTPNFPQRYTQDIYEVNKGEPIVVIGLLQDLFQFSQELRRMDSVKDTASAFNSYQQTMNIQQWLEKNSIDCGDLSESTLKDFKTGLKLCEIVEKACKRSLANLILHPKTTAQALWNARKALEALYSSYPFPQKYNYLDDLLISGDGPTIRLFLTDLLSLI